MRPRVTMSDIARATGLSRPAVTLALSNKGTLSSSTRARVLAAAKELGYRPNASARAVVTGSTSNIGLLSSSDAGSGGLIHMNAFWTIESELSARGFSLMSSLIPPDAQANPSVIPRLLREWSVDGMIISHYFDTVGPLEEALRGYERSSVWLNAKGEHNSVYFDDFGAAEAGTRRLLKLHHRKIVFARSYASIHYSFSDRLNGYLQVMGAARAKPRVLDATVFDSSKTFVEAWQRVLSAPDRPTAILVDDDRLCVALICATKLCKLKLPEDLSIISISDSREPILDVSVERLRLPFGDSGRAAVSLLLDRLKHPGQPHPSKVLKLQNEAGTTVGPPPVAK